MKNTEQPLPGLLKGIDEFNRQEFFECHETLEDLWRDQKEPERQFTQGVIQIAVGYYHLLRSNRAGARKLFARGLARISAFKPVYLTVRTAELASAVEATLALLTTTPDSAPVEFAIPKIETANHSA